MRIARRLIRRVRQVVACLVTAHVLIGLPWANSSDRSVTHGHSESPIHTPARAATESPMLTIQAGMFLMGTPRTSAVSLGLEGPYDDTEQPQRRIWLDAYSIDRDEVSLGQYLR